MTAAMPPPTAPDATLPQAPSLARVARGDLCAGCGACAGLLPDRIALQETPPGFLRPHQTAPLTPAEDARIARICPGLGQRVAAGGRRDDPLWGPFLEMHTGWATDPELRHAGASGGGLSALLAHLLDSGRVTAVVQTAADPARPIANAMVLSATPQDILRAAGSRYAPSAPLADLGRYIALGQPLAFVGKPCDVAALRALAAEDARIARAFPVMLSFFCAGVPSHAGARATLAALGVEEAALAAFRYRGQGWPGRATARLRDGTEHSMSYHDSWGGILSRHVQHRCRICADGTGTAADIVCADAWDCDAQGYPLFHEAPGVSLIVTRTPLGAQILAEARKAGRLATAPFDPARLSTIQPGQRERRRALLARLAALRLCGRPVPDYRGLQLGAAARSGHPGRILRNFLGMLRRVLQGRAAPRIPKKAQP